MNSRQSAAQFTVQFQALLAPTPVEVMHSGIMPLLMEECGKAAKRAYLDCVKRPIAEIVRRSKWGDVELAAFLSEKSGCEISRQTAQRLRSGHRSVLGMGAWKLDSILASLGSPTEDRTKAIQLAVCGAVVRHAWRGRFLLVRGSDQLPKNLLRVQPEENSRRRTQDELERSAFHAELASGRWPTAAVVEGANAIHENRCSGKFLYERDRQRWARWLERNLPIAEQFSGGAVPMEMLVSVADYVMITTDVSSVFSGPAPAYLEYIALGNSAERLVELGGNWS